LPKKGIPVALEKREKEKLLAVALPSVRGVETRESLSGGEKNRGWMETNTFCS